MEYYNSFRSPLFDWMWLRFRLDRSPVSIRRFRLAAYSGFCLQCPTQELNFEHIMYICPRFNQERADLFRELSFYLSIPQVPLDIILTLGIDRDPRKTLIIAKSISKFFGSIITSSRIP